MVNSLATPSVPARKRRPREQYEGSAADERQDKRSAKKRGMSVKAYERTAEDKRQDKAGQKRLDKREKPDGLRHAFREAFSGKPPTASSSVNDGLRIRRPKGAGRGR